MIKTISLFLVLLNVAFASDTFPEGGFPEETQWDFQCTDGCVDVCDHFSKPYKNAQCDGLTCRCICKDNSSWGSGVTCGAGRLAGNAYMCFSSHTTASVKGKGLTRMNNIEVGDQVLTVDGVYKTIYSIDHQHPTKLTSFLQIHSSKQHEPLELTEKHMVFLQGKKSPVPANSIRVGDKLKGLEGPSIVTNIDIVTREGLFSPITTDGTIVASGIVASSYSAFFGSSEWIEITGKKTVTHQDFFDKLLKPYRYICTGFSLEFCKTKNEKIAISKFAANSYEYLLGQTEIFQMIVLFCVIFFAYLVDFILSPGGFVLPIFSAVCYWRLGAKNEKQCKRTA